ncbi:hypothetical protein ROV80_05285 [Stenotrophomonas pavanii]|uniref:hypothetical protein n=1 Tax=Stenotrophomonas pavanii TaxID=487698 RepID=UPI0028952E69|nr:hypothetical protein [Stenotrophomonas pavanii]MDT3454656.1 hypothetical protein [Stenotrophomonas pavanii]
MIAFHCWRPFVRLHFAETPGDLHWWVNTAEGHTIHQWLALHVVENGEGAKILQVIIGPMMRCLAARLKKEVR